MWRWAVESDLQFFNGGGEQVHMHSVWLFFLSLHKPRPIWLLIDEIL